MFYINPLSCVYIVWCVRSLVCTLSGVYALWCVVFQCFCLVTIFVPLEEIGQKTWTSLSLKLNHFRDFWTCLEGKINHLLQEQWPTPNVGWPEEGTFEPHYPSGKEGRLWAIGAPGSGSLYHYLTNMVEKPPKWVKPFLPPPQVIVVIVAEKKLNTKGESQPSAPLYPVLPPRRRPVGGIFLSTPPSA